MKDNETTHSGPDNERNCISETGSESIPSLKKGGGVPGRVSIIMTTYNSSSHIEQTLKSVLSQDYPDLEIVIADGGSKDGTVDIIRHYAGQKIAWISEPDRGIYDGMNKAIRMSTGEIIAVCNDLFTCDDAVLKMVRAISGHVIGAHADLAYVDGNRVIRRWVMGEGKIEDGWLPAHPTLYLKREVYEKYGLYDLRYHSSSDYEFMVRVLKHPENRLAYVHEELIHMFYGGTSNAGWKGYLRNTREAYEALKANEIPHPGRVIMKRIMKTLRQFR